MGRFKNYSNDEERIRLSTTLTTKTGQLDIYSEAFDEVIEAIRADYDWRNKKGGRQHPWTGVQLLKDFRFGAITLPKDLGGAGASIEDLFTAVIRIAEADPELAPYFPGTFHDRRISIEK